VPDQTTQPVRRAKHLIDPADPRPRPSGAERKRDEASLNRVREWVMSALVVTTMFHLAAGLTVAAIFTDDDKTGARVGLNVIAAIILTAGVAGARAIHHKNPVSVWLVLGVLPTVVGLWLTFR
jgi:hypothetical protein